VRIVSGIARGRSLFTPPPNERTIRPTSDKAREALFSILGRVVDGAKVLDLFAGTGALGLEAFSRGAASVVFVDVDRNALELIRRNISRLFINFSHRETLQVVADNLTGNLWQDNLLRFAPEGFDLIFADPPYGQGLALATLVTLDKSTLLAENGMLIIEERFNIALPEELPRLRQVDQRRYGEAGLRFYQRLAEPLVRQEKSHPI
jgi:16S rRNA (guanine966-N2)-methyltransferase